MSKMPTSPISRRTLCGLAGSALFLSQLPRAAFAAGGPSGLKVDFPQQGELGEVIGNQKWRRGAHQGSCTRRAEKGRR